MGAEKQTRDDLTNDQEPSAEYWQAKVERLQEVVCFLLMKKRQCGWRCLWKATEPFGESVAAYTNRDIYRLVALTPGS